MTQHAPTGGGRGRRVTREPMKKIVLALTSVVAIACGGGNPSPSPTPVAAPAPAPTPAPAPPPALTVSEVAVSISNTMNVAFIAAMRAGSLSASTGSSHRGSGLLALLQYLLPQPLYAQGNSFIAPCPQGGNATVRYGGAR